MVLRKFMSGGYHLPSGVPQFCLPILKKKTKKVVELNSNLILASIPKGE